MTRTRLLLSVVAAVLVASCASASATAAPTQSAVQSLGSSATRSGGTFRVETENLVIEYPDVIDRAQAARQAGTLQEAYDAFRVIFAFDDAEHFGGAKTTIRFTLATSQTDTDDGVITIGRAVTGSMRDGHVNPPAPTILHEMAHLLVQAQAAAGRFYVYQQVPGMNEGLADYMSCHPDILRLWSEGPRSQERCDLVLRGIGAKSGYSLAEYETQKIDPYTLDWRAHPPSGAGEAYLPQMLARVSDRTGWGVWRKLFTATRDAGGNPGANPAIFEEAWAKKKPANWMSDPLVRQAFREFVAGLGAAGGQDLRPMFRAWGFEV